MSLKKNIEDKILYIKPELPDAELIEKAALCIREGGLVIFPSSCLYGIAVDAQNEDAIERVFEIKGRDKDKALLILVEDMDSALSQTSEPSSEARALMERFWPGRLTLVLKAGAGVSKKLRGKTAKIGLRVPAHPVARALLKAVGRPITGTSANLSGESPVCLIKKLAPEIKNKADLIIDSGRLKGGFGSSVVDISVKPPLILREGSLPAVEIENFLKTRH